jgi:ferredoxin/flavodoxin---NADP+ reductase
MSNLREESVLSVRHWTEDLFSFTTTRNESLRFRSGQFVMIGLSVDGRPLLRAYSIASAHYDDHLEFFSIKAPSGPLTSRLRDLKRSDTILVGTKPTGTLLLENLTHGRNLYLIATGTGLAPFLSLIKDPEVYDRFDKVILAHGCRQIKELAYQEIITRDLPAHELLGDQIRRQLIYYPAVTREPYQNRGRLTELLREGRLHQDLGLPRPTPEADRFMVCGGPYMLSAMMAQLVRDGFCEGSIARPGDYVVERAFVGEGVQTP